MTRLHKRAPYLSEVIVCDGRECFHCQGVNISEGGMLVEDIPSLDENGDLRIIFSVEELPDFSILLDETTGLISPTAVKRKKIYFRAQGRFARISEERSSLDLLFKTFVGIQYTVIDKNAPELILKYVEMMENNILYLITLIQKRDLDVKILPKIKQGLMHLKMDPHQNLELAHKKLIRDYQGLN